jgi:hypothetical protein
MKCELDSGDREVSSDLVAIFKKVKESDVLQLKREISDENYDRLMKFAGAYSRMDTKMRETYNPKKWEGSHAESWYKMEIQDLSLPDVIQILNVSTKLGFEPMIEVGCWHIANLIKDKSTEEIRKLLKIADETSDADLINWG